MADVYGDSSQKYFTVTQSAEFKHGRDSLEDDEDIVSESGKKCFTITHVISIC